ncbi:preprotein translocase subunit SecA, partial [Candidatus Saccharibacteria bacterium]|nr:preprotein translocase subunit SecA [Candidatus Saccharibacteria bacterium]
AETMRKVEREVYLKVLDTLWMQHLENMQHLREGIHWRSVGQRDPLVEYRTEAQKLFDGLQRNLREEVLKVILSLTRQEAEETGVTDGQEYESELTKMAEGSTEKGVNEVSAGEKNLDSEFKKKSTAPSHGGTAKSGSKTKKSSKKSGKKSSKSKKKKSKKKGRK